MIVTGRQQKKNPPKHQDVLGEVRKCIKTGRYLDTRHAKMRKKERVISLPEVLHVLLEGCHEKRKDKYEQLYKA